MLSALSPARRRVVLALAALVAVALVGAGASLVFQAVTGSGAGAAATSAQAPQDQPGPVLLVPGYGGSVTALSSLARVLTAEGKDVTVVALPEDGRGDLRVQARALGAETSAVRTRTGARSVDVVGYSAGGVVARYWVQELGGRAQTRRLVTLGSPNHGTDVAELGALFDGACPLACQQLLPTSSLLAALDKDVPAEGPRVVSIWSTVDDVVLPPDSARLAGALNVTVQSVCAASQVRHSGLPADPVVQHMVGAQLGAGPPLQLGPADCGRLGT